MKSFENYLLSKGYLKFVFNTKEMKFQKSKNHIISTMVNLDHRYIHKDDKNLLDKISNGETIGKGITKKDREKVIVIGLHESGKPETLIYPRPKIRVIRNVENQKIVQKENFDDSMNLVLQKISPEKIYEALFDKSIVFKFDLTK